MSQEQSLSIANPHPEKINSLQKLALIAGGSGLLILVLALLNGTTGNHGLFLTAALTLIAGGTILYGYAQYKDQNPGIKNNGVWFRSISGRGAIGWTIGVVLTAFYVSLYWFPSWIGYQAGVDGSNIGLVALFDPLSELFKGEGRKASQWFVYGTLYTLAILSLGIKFMYKYRHNRYQLIRTVSVIIAQLALAYLVPEILAGLNYNDVSAVATDGTSQYLGWYDMDIKNTWPLDYDFFHNWHLDAMQQEKYQPLGMVYLFSGLAMFLVVTPVLTYFLGKRWYCSWVCGCGGLAETAGDSFRHLSSKKLSSWKLERWLMHSIMILVLVMTIATLYGYVSNQNTFLGLDIYTYFQKPYGFIIGAMFSGVIGVGFYPMLGNRVWCRFGCPMAGYMGLIQRFKSRFRITTNGGQCISCGNCSTYCEQGIDVRWYAQRGENIVRASCVGCGICSAVCPRGVLKLENGPEENRVHGPIEISSKGIEITQD